MRFNFLQVNLNPFDTAERDDLSVIETTSDLSHANQTPFLISTSICPS